MRADAASPGNTLKDQMIESYLRSLVGYSPLSCIVRHDWRDLAHARTHAHTHTHTHTPWPNESETLGMGPGNLTPGAADAGWSSWATSNWWNLIPWASWKSTKDHSGRWFRRRRQTGNSLQIRGEGEHGQLTRAIFPDDLSLIPFWNVGSQYLGREVSLGQDGKGGPGTPNSPDQTCTPLRLAWDLTWSVF